MQRRKKDGMGFVPSPSEIVTMQKHAKELAKQLQQHMKEETVVVGGSVAKGTFIRGSNDIDMFVIYAHERTKEALERDVMRAVKSAFPTAKIQVSYAEHPYVKVFMGAYKIDVVPAFRFLKGSVMRSSVDRSIEHVKFIQKNTTKKQRIQIVILKKFLKARGLYGAEIRVKGFSGYLCELLVIACGTFNGVLRKFKEGDVSFIDIKKHHKKSNVRQLLEKMNAPLVVIDPTDPNRNVAAALSKENLAGFIRAAGKFLKKPDPNAFLKTPANFEERVGKTRNCTVVVTKRPAINDDILWGQIHRLEDKLKNSLLLSGFEGVKVFSDADELGIRVAISVKKTDAHPHFWAPGPLLSMPFHIENFKRANDGRAFKEERGRIWAWKKRKVHRIRDALLEFFANEVLPSHISREVCIL